MCVMCYIGTDVALSEIMFDQENPEFFLEKADITEFSPTTFTTENVYFVGTREGCGCGFGIDAIPEEISLGIRNTMKGSKHVPEEYRDYFQYEDTIEEIEETINRDNAFAEDTQKLYSLIKDLCERGEKVEFVACWAGTENVAPEIELHKRTASNDLQIDFSAGRDATLKITFEK